LLPKLTPIASWLSPLLHSLESLLFIGISMASILLKTRLPFLKKIPLDAPLSFTREKQEPSSSNPQKMAEIWIRNGLRDFGRGQGCACPFLGKTQNYKVVILSEHLESHKSEFGRVSYAQNATVAQNRQKILLLLFFRKCSEP